MLHKPSRPASTSLRRTSSGGCKQLERVAGWVSAGLYTAFFASLDRCACVKLDTIEMQEPIIVLRSKDQPLLPKPPLKKLPSSTEHHDEDSPPPLP